MNKESLKIIIETTAEKASLRAIDVFDCAIDHLETEINIGPRVAVLKYMKAMVKWELKTLEGKEDE